MACWAAHLRPGVQKLHSAWCCWLVSDLPVRADPQAAAAPLQAVLRVCWPGCVRGLHVLRRHRSLSVQAVSASEVLARLKCGTLVVVGGLQVCSMMRSMASIAMARVKEAAALLEEIVPGGVLTSSPREKTGRMNFSSKSAHHSASCTVCGLPPALPNLPQQAL